MYRTIALGAGLCVVLAIGVWHFTPERIQDVVSDVVGTASTSPQKRYTFNGITEYQLSNGLKVLLYPDTSSTAITVNVTYLVGSRHENYGETGMAHLLEHMLFKGSKNHPKIDEEMSAHGAQSNATTWLDRTNYFETIPAKPENLEWALALESDRMVRSFIRQEDLDKEMTVVRNEMEGGENDPNSKLVDEVMNTAFLWHNYGKSTIGARSDVEHVPATNLKKFYEMYYQPDNAVLVVAGNFQEDVALTFIQNTFGTLEKPRRVLKKEYTVEPPQAGAKTIEIQGAQSTPSILLGYHVPSGVHPDSAALDVAAALLTSVPDGVLTTQFVDTKRATAVGGGQMLLKDPGYVLFSMTPAVGVPVSRLADEFQHTLEHADTLHFTDQELQRTKALFKKADSDLYTNLESFALSLTEWVALGDWRLFFAHSGAVQNVTLDDVRRVMNTYFVRSNSVRGIYTLSGSQQKVAIPLTDSKDIQKEIESLPASSVEQGAYFDPSLEHIAQVARKMSNDAGTFYFVEKDTRGNRVSASFSFEYGNENDLRGHGALAAFASQFFMLGTSSKSENDIKDALLKLDASIGITARGSVLSVMVESKKDTFPETLRLLEDILKHPTFSQKQFERVRGELIAQLVSDEDLPQTKASEKMRALQNVFPKGDIRAPLTTQELAHAYGQFTKTEVLNFMRRFYGSNHMTGAIIGEFNLNDAIEGLNTSFGTWKAPVSYQRLRGDHCGSVVRNESIYIPEKSDAYIVGQFCIPLTYSDSEYPALVIANYILGGDGMNSLLMKRIREEEGLSYGTGSFFAASAEEPVAIFSFDATAAPQNIPKTKEVFTKLFSDFVERGITETVLKKGKQSYQEMLLQSHAQDADLASYLDGLLSGKLSIESEIAFEKNIQAVPAATVNAALKKYFSVQSMSFVSAGTF